MKRRGKWLGLLWAIAGLFLVGGAGYGLWAFQEARAQKEKAEIPLNLLAKASRENIETRLLLTGEVAPAFSVEVKSEINGRVESIHVTTGQAVKRGDPLLTIDDTDLLTEKSAAQTEIEGAQLEVDKRRGNYERAKALFEEKLISKEVFANLEADLKIAENNLVKAGARLQSVEDRLSKTRILAPADGSVLNINVNEGQVVAGANNVNSGVVLMNFADLSRLTIQTHVNQMDLGKVKVGDELLIRMPPPDETPVTARVEFIAPVATVRNNIKGFAVEAIISHPDERLRPGMSVSLTLPLGKAEGAIAVPVSAVFREDDGDRYVYVRQAGRTERRAVIVGISNFSYAEILEGLDEGEEILLAPPKDLTEKG
jgi:RND family efflux transporter MFP subunit